MVLIPFMQSELFAQSCDSRVNLPNQSCIKRIHFDASHVLSWFLISYKLQIGDSPFIYCHTFRQEHRRGDAESSHMASGSVSYESVGWLEDQDNDTNSKNLKSDVFFPICIMFTTVDQ